MHNNNEEQSECPEKNDDIDEALLTVVQLHRHPEYLQQCCELVNEEWPRSETARMMSLKSSCDKMPTCLILLTGDKKVIGHCKLTPIPSVKTSCFVESVVIKKALRGKGLGTFLMNASEEYCRSVLKLATIHLSTINRENFYAHLGYNICEPVTIYGSFTQIDNNDHSKKTNTIMSNCPVPPPMTNLKIDSLQKKSNKIYMVKSLI